MPRDGCTEATAATAAGARAVVLVEGVSDQIAVAALAARRGRDLGADGIAVVPAGGAHGFARYARRLGPAGAGVSLAGLCDAPEEGTVRRALAAAGIWFPLHVCVADLEDELIRAAGTALAEELLAAQGDLGSFRTMQRQPAWRGKPVDAQLRRFLGAGSQRKLRYARLLAGAIDLSRIPEPLEAVLTGFPARS